jgi:VanZ family protein
LSKIGNLFAFLSVFAEKKSCKTRKKVNENIDRAIFFAYNKSMEKINRKLLWAVRILLSVACAFAVGFILYNSIQTAVESAKQSSRAVEVVQKVVATVAPNSPIVMATGDAYDRLHAVVRTLAHFSEYALLGALVAWCYRSYTDKKLWLGITGGGVAVLAVMDECLQTFSAGRGAQFSDVLVDIFGGGVGISFALFTVWLVGKMIGKRRGYETR